MVSAGGIEPPASSLSARCSDRLSYTESLLALLSTIDDSGVMPRYSKEELRAALVGAKSWSDVNTRLGRAPDARSKVLRDLAEAYGLDTSGITTASARSYTDEQLTAAVKQASSWGEVAELLGKSRHAGASIQVMRRAADRLGLDARHLDRNGRPAAR